MISVAAELSVPSKRDNPEKFYDVMPNFSKNLSERRLEKFLPLMAQRGFMDSYE